MSIAMMLREGTAEKHQETEKVPYLRAIFRGGLDAQTYTYQLESLLAVYTVMEELYRQNKDNPILSKLYFPTLFREEALKEDITSFQKKFNTKLRGVISKATQSYIDHIKKIRRNQTGTSSSTGLRPLLGRSFRWTIHQKSSSKNFPIGRK